MTKAFSLYLDLVRLMAAVLVVLAHYLQFGILKGETAAYVPDFGREAVIIFFVMSGYVIAYTTANKQSSLQEYAIARCARIYSVAAPVLVIAFVATFITTTLIEKNIDGAYSLEKAYLYIPFHLLFLGELWNFSEVPPWLAVYWSLGYEVWYYVLFGVIYYLTGARRIFFALLILAIIGHKLWLLMPIWWAGVLLYKNQDRYQPSRTTARAGWLITLLLLLIYKAIGLDLLLREFGNHIWGLQPLKLGSADRYLADFVVGLLIVFNFFFALHAKLDTLLSWKRSIKVLSSYTFTLYLVHGLVIDGWNHFYDNSLPSLFNVFFLTVLIAAATFLTGMLTERRKAVFQRFFEKLIKRKTVVSSAFSESRITNIKKP